MQSIFSAIGGGTGKSFLIGGDGRFFNADAIQTIVRMAAAQGASRVVIGQGGLMSTPAASNVIRQRGLDGGFILSASHNPGGIDADFGLKFNGANGGPAPEALTQAMFAASRALEDYQIAQGPAVDLNALGETRLGDMVVEVIDPVTDYAALMEELFDFPAISRLFSSGFTMCFDAMHAVTGPYAIEIFERRLGAPEGTVINGVPSENFGGGHPDPNPVWAKDLMERIMSDTPPDFGAASDGDGDRNMITGPSLFVSPSDSLAVLAANATLAPAYDRGVAGVARSMPTSGAVDRVAEALAVEVHETPTGWNFFGTLLDAGRVTLCGEESAGTGSDHVREKDGLWAVLLWLNILAATGKTVPQIMADHWARFGRNYYARHDYEAVDAALADQVVEALRGALSTLPGRSVQGRSIEAADEFTYVDPVDGSMSSNQGLRVYLSGGGRIVVRLSGTGTEGATIRLYLEDFEPGPEGLEANPNEALAALTQIAEEITGIRRITGRAGPDVVT